MKLSQTYPTGSHCCAQSTRSILRDISEPRARAATTRLPRFLEPAVIEKMINATFWASLRREEGYVPKISMAFLPPEHDGIR